MLMGLSAIVTSRKRKLRQLFAVATQVDTLPNDGLAHPDEPAATSAEWQFLQAGDILKCVSRSHTHCPLLLFAWLGALRATRTRSLPL